MTAQSIKVTCINDLRHLAMDLNCSLGRIKYQIKKGSDPYKLKALTYSRCDSYKLRVQRSGLTKMQGQRALRMSINPEDYLSRLMNAKIDKLQKAKSKKVKIKRIRGPMIAFMKRKSDRFNPKYGTTSNEFRAHIEKQFTRKMTWENHGKVWHLDHIMPLSRFDLNDRNQVLIACNWQNFQPLLARENLSKSDKILVPQLSLILQTK
jgi:hypothetical protein